MLLFWDSGISLTNTTQKYQCEERSKRGASDSHSHTTDAGSVTLSLKVLGKFSPLCMKEIHVKPACEPLQTTCV